MLLAFASCALVSSPESRIAAVRDELRTFDTFDATFAIASNRLALEHTRVIADARGRVAVLPLDHAGRRYLRDAEGLAWSGPGLHEPLERAPGLDDLAKATWDEIRGGIAAGTWIPAEPPRGVTDLLPGVQWSVARPAIAGLGELDVHVAMARFSNSPARIVLDVGGYAVHAEVSGWTLDEPLEAGLFSPSEWPR